jgi:hypothetical protein
MLQLIRTTARVLGLLCFFTIFLIGIDPENVFDPQTIIPALLKGCCGLVLFWFCGFVIADIVYKGIVHHMQENTFDEIEGGFVQRFVDVKKDAGLRVTRIDAETTSSQAAAKKQT